MGFLSAFELSDKMNELKTALDTITAHNGLRRKILLTLDRYKPTGGKAVMHLSSTLREEASLTNPNAVNGVQQIIDLMTELDYSKAKFTTEAQEESESFIIALCGLPEESGQQTALDMPPDDSHAVSKWEVHTAEETQLKIPESPDDLLFQETVAEFQPTDTVVEETVSVEPAAEFQEVSSELEQLVTEKEDVMATVAEHLSEYVKVNFKSVKAFADHIGVNQVTAGRALKGGSVSKKTQEKIEEMTGVAWYSGEVPGMSSSNQANDDTDTEVEVHSGNGNGHSEASNTEPAIVPKEVVQPSHDAEQTQVANVEPVVPASIEKKAEEYKPSIGLPQLSSDSQGATTFGSDLQRVLRALKNSNFLDKLYDEFQV